MEKKFLLYLLYITLVEIREKSYIEKDERTFWLTDLLHNIPFQIETEAEAIEAYNEILKKVSELKIEKWLEEREKEFFQRFPNYSKS